MDNNLCPFSFAFSIKNVSPPLVSLNQPGKIKISIGFPCVKEKCAWWDNTIHQCRILTIQMLLEEILNKKGE